MTIEHFHDDEEAEFRIHSRKAILSILSDIEKKGTSVALYYDAHNFLQTKLLYVSEDGLWLDVGPFPPENKRILLSDKITFVGMHQHVKVQFVAYGILEATFGDDDAFYLELPDQILRIQRREFFRLNVPVKDALKCTIISEPLNPRKPDEPAVYREAPREVLVVDISGGGISLLCDENEEELRPGRIFKDCRIKLPTIGMLIATIEVKNHVKTVASHGRGLKCVRAGCRFINLDSQMSFLLQQYIMLLQSESLTKGV